MTELFRRTKFAVGDFQPVPVYIDHLFNVGGPAAMRVPKGYLSDRTGFVLYEYKDYIWARNRRLQRLKERDDDMKQHMELLKNESLYNYT